MDAPRGINMSRLRMAPAIVAVCAVIWHAAPARAVGIAEIEGRWATASKDLVLDISQCGERYCGQLIKADNQCGRTVLTVLLKAPSPESQSLVLEGRLELPGHRSVYKARVMVNRQPQDKDARMTILGDDPDGSFVRRTFPFQAHLVRAGNAASRPDLPGFFGPRLA